MLSKPLFTDKVAPEGNTFRAYCVLNKASSYPCTSTVTMRFNNVKFHNCSS